MDFKVSFSWIRSLPLVGSCMTMDRPARQFACLQEVLWRLTYTVIGKTSSPKCSGRHTVGSEYVLDVAFVTTATAAAATIAAVISCDLLLTILVLY